MEGKNPEREIGVRDFHTILQVMENQLWNDLKQMETWSG